jgi:hypothetical protein
MNNLSIDNIFNNNNYNYTNMNQVDITSLFNYKYNVDKVTLPKSHTVDINKLITTKENKKNKIKSNYCNIYNNLILKINKEDDRQKTFLIFNIPQVMLSCPEYSYLDCISYIKHHLEENKIDMLMLDNYIMFVSWKNIEKNN